ncbi:MAG: DUF4097 family beta strand repeat-containing protein [Promicromonosporaceae bacterium]|nr:DUF4097 family beta strand repeat-containing protein [Promicromonosporaceae bacterium]
MKTERWTITEPQTIELDDVTSLSAHIVDGRLDVVAHDEPNVRVEIHATNGRPVEVRLERGGKLTVGHETLSGWKSFVEKFGDFTGNARADIFIAAPRHLTAKVGSVRGETMLAGMIGDLRANSVSGPILVTETEGTLDVNTVSGEVTVREHRGNVDANTVSGDTTITGWVPNADVNSVSGAITFDLFDQPRRIKSNSVSGAVLMRLPDANVVEAKLDSLGGRLMVNGVEAGGFGTKLLRPVVPTVTTVKATAVSGDVTVIGRQDAPDGGL